MTEFSSARFTVDDFATMTRESKLVFRRGAQDVFRICLQHDIEMLIVSGGIYELIEQSLLLLEEENGKPGEYSSISILSNQFEYENDTAVGYKTPLIHSGNKQGIIYDQVKVPLRRNALVMGDIVEDGGMVRHSEHETLLKVGFINTEDRYDTQLDSYKETFDIIINKDGSFCPVVYSLNALFKAGVEAPLD